MKKLLALCIALLLILSLAACAADGDTDNDDGKDNSGGAAIDYYITYNNVRIDIGAEAQPLISSLGSYTVEEGEACPGGIDTDIYTFSGIEIMVYKDSAKNTETVGKISILSDAVSTAKGITIGDTEQGVTAAYGKSYTKGSTGALCYEGKSSSIEFHFTDAKVSNIYVKTK